MDATLILTKTAKGIQEAKTEGGGLHYDAVRLLRLVNGKATVRDLRPQFSDLTDARFLKAIADLQHKGLVRALGTIARPAADRSETPQLDAQVSEVAHEVLQTLDFSKLDRNLLDAMRSSPPQPEAAVAAAPKQPHATQPAAAARAHPEPAAKVQPAPGSPEAETHAQLVAALRPHVEAELRATLMDTLRPEIEDELRRQLVVALRPALEAEIRTKLTAALKPRVELELRMKDQLGRTMPAPEQAPWRLLECMQEAIFQTDTAGRTVYVNPAWKQLTGCAAEDAIGRPLIDFFCAEDQRRVAVLLEGIAAGKTTATTLEANLAREKGGPRRVEVRAAPLTAAAGDNIGVCGTLRGVSQAQDRATKP